MVFLFIVSAIFIVALTLAAVVVGVWSSSLIILLLL
jgi:hypothetical protein